MTGFINGKVMKDQYSKRFCFEICDHQNNCAPQQKKKKTIKTRKYLKTISYINAQIFDVVFLP